jgi:hypothetical protein
MKNPILVRIIASNENFWYEKLIGKTIYVESYSHRDFKFVDFTKESEFYKDYILKRGNNNFIDRTHCQYLNGMPAGHTSKWFMFEHVARIYNRMIDYNFDPTLEANIYCMNNFLYGTSCSAAFTKKFVEKIDAIKRVAPIFRRQENALKDAASRSWIGSFTYDKATIVRTNATTFTIRYDNYDPGLAWEKFKAAGFITFKGRAPRNIGVPVWCKMEGFKYPVEVHGDIRASFFNSKVVEWYIAKDNPYAKTI